MRGLCNLPRPMSSPAEITTPPEPGFDPLVFWISHRSKILLLAGVFLVALTAFAVSEWARMRKLDGARQLLAGAKSAESYRQVIAEYPGTAAAGDATLLLAGQLRKEGKFDESSALLRTFTEKYSEHQLISGAWTSLAANLEAQDKTDEALAMHQKVSASYALSFSAPVALMAQARLLTAKGKTEEARRIYEQVTVRFPDNVVSVQAAQEIRQLK